MKLKYFGLLLLGMSILFGAVSCKSSPPADEEGTSAQSQPSYPGVDKAAADDLNAAIARANAARKLVMDFNGANLFPADWQSADSLFGQAEQQKDTSTTESVRASTARYVTAAEALEKLAGITLIRNYEIKERDLTDARFAVVHARAEDIVPDLLFDADAAAAEADGKFKAEDYYGARDSAQTAQTMYEVLKAGLDSYAIREEIVGLGGLVLIPELVSDADDVSLDGFEKYRAKNFTAAKEGAEKSNAMYSLLKSGLLAYKMREEIISHNFEVYDPISVDDADVALDYAADAYNRENFPAAREEIDQAMLLYGVVLKAGWEAYAADRGAEASTERQKALDLKANVAVRQEFNSAQTLFTQGNTAFREGRHVDAARFYAESASMLEVINEVTREKRRVAEEALIMANQKMQESDENARNAERILEGGAQ